MRDIRLGIEAGRFRVSNVTYAASAISGVTLSFLPAVSTESSVRMRREAAAIVLELVGISARQAEAIASRSLPQIPFGSRNAPA